MEATGQEISVTLKFTSFAAFTEAMAKLYPTAAETIAALVPPVVVPPADPKDHVNLAEPAATTGRKRGRKTTPAPAEPAATAATLTEHATTVGAAAGAVEGNIAVAAATNLFDTPPATATPPAAAAPNPNPSIDDCRKALSDVNDKFGMSVAHSMLGEVGAERISLIPEDKRAVFVANCKAKLATAAVPA